MTGKFIATTGGLLYKAAVQLFIAAIAVWLDAGAALAQDVPTLGDRFARVAIREHQESRRQSTLVDMYGNHILNGTSLIVIIRAAYFMPEFRIVDGPDWIYEWNLYDIEAVPPPAELVDSDPTQMLRSMLRDHFKLQLRETTREMKVMALEFVEDSPALQKREPQLLHLRPGQTEGIALRSGTSASGEYRDFSAELTLATVAGALTREIGRNVVDMTGLEGIWTLELDAVPLAGPQVRFEPVLAQLGLRLVERTLPLDVLQITHVERPRLDGAAP